MPGEPFLTFWEQRDVLFIVFFEVFSHFEAGAVYVHNPASCILSWLSWEEEEEAAGWQDM